MKNLITDTFISKSNKQIILALEASTNQLSIAIMVDGVIAASQKHIKPYGHAAGIVPLSIQVLNEAGLKFNSITHVAAGCGPGSFTGIRVTLAAAKGFCLAYGAVGIGLSGLQALATAATDHDQIASTACLCLTETRRGTLYAQLFDTRGQPLGVIFEAKPSQIPFLIDINASSKGIRLLGMSCAAVAAAFNEINIATCQPAIDMMPNATMMAHLAAKNIACGEIAALEPLYLADPRLGPEKKSS